MEYKTLNHFAEFEFPAIFSSLFSHKISAVKLIKKAREI